MQITIAAATRLELREAVLKQNTAHSIDFLYTGVGLLSSAVSLTQYALQHKTGLIIQAGIAGSFTTNLNLGSVVVVQKDSLGDTGVEEKEGWKDLFDMGFQQADVLPFAGRYLPNEHLEQWNVLALPAVIGTTVNEVTTSEVTMQRLQAKYAAQTESMEGASLHYVCRLYNIPFVQVRAISNYVGERDKGKWTIKEAIENLNATVLNMLNTIE